MPTTYVFVDVETTGLNPDRDDIIEVGAVALRGDEIVAEFSSLVNPYADIPEAITRLTGITQAMVDEAPGMFAIKNKVRDIVADRVVVGHNVGFDLGFLGVQHIGVNNHRLDTVTLASILYPRAGRFGLGALATALDLPRPAEGQTHRALDDARLTLELFLRLQDRALEVDGVLLEEIVRAGKVIGWPETLFFEAALAEQARTAFEGRRKRGGQRLVRLFTPRLPDGHAPLPAEHPVAIDPAILTGMLQPGGNFSRAFPGFEYRPQQVEMLEAVTDALNEGGHLLVEAGTGTGKSIGYLLPAAFWAYENGRRVVVSTNTINLQDQLLNKDIPELQKILPFELRAALRKGRRNYLCTRLFQQMRHNGPASGDEMALFARLLLWLPTTESGDVAEITLRTPGERLAWARMNGDNVVCRTEDCAQAGCPLHVARQRAELAHIVVVNHALLLSDVANENHILPEFYDLIIDEAHHLETAVTDGLSFRADKRQLSTILEEISKPRSGLVADVAARTGQLPDQFRSVVAEYVTALREAADQGAYRLDDFFNTLGYFMRDYVNSRSSFAQRVRLTDAHRAQAAFDELLLSWDNLSKVLHGIAEAFLALAAGIGDLGATGMLDEAEELRLALASNGRDLAQTREAIHQLIADPQPEMIYWFEQYNDSLSLHAAPLHVGPLVEQHVFHSKESVILTSATLRTAAAGRDAAPTFDYLRDRLHAHDVAELAVGSPFDYANSTLLYLCTDIPEPNQPGYQRYVEDAIVDVAGALRGRTMVLFTSYKQLNETAGAIAPRLQELGVGVLTQTAGVSRQQLLDQFKQPAARAVLLGTRSFWEGVDVPGEALQAVMLARIPFDVPSDPVFAARAETFENSFMAYSVPEAVLRFRQGFGRLIRRQEDMGVVVVLDKRVLSKRYGQYFIDALPPCTVLRQRTSRLGELTLRWLNRDRRQA